MSVVELAERTAEIGHHVPRQTITALEGGRRQGVTLPEILVIARALDLPPLLLIIPFGAAATEVLPDELSSPVEAAAWFIGSAGLPDDADNRLYYLTAPAIGRAFTHEGLLRQLVDLAAKEQEDTEEAAARADQRLSLVVQLGRLREDMLTNGDTLPPLPVELQHEIHGYHPQLGTIFTIPAIPGGIDG